MTRFQVILCVHVTLGLALRVAGLAQKKLSKKFQGEPSIIGSSRISESDKGDIAQVVKDTLIQRRFQKQLEEADEAEEDILGRRHKHKSHHRHHHHSHREHGHHRQRHRHQHHSGHGIHHHEYFLSQTGHVQLRSAHKHSNDAHEEPKGGNKFFDCSQSYMSAAEQAECEQIRPDFEGLEKVLKENGLNDHNRDGTIFADGKGITVGLYKEHLKPGTTSCETGFGGGHGALLSLEICQDCNIYVFDSGSYPYAKAAAEWLQQKFPGRLHMTWGDSAKTLPKFMADNAGVKCDFVMIDGGRSYRMAKKDTLNFAKMVSSASVTVLQHDCPVPGLSDKLNGVCRAWHDLGKSGCVTNLHDLVTVSSGHFDAEKCSAQERSPADSEGSTSSTESTNSSDAASSGGETEKKTLQEVLDAMAANSTNTSLLAKYQQQALIFPSLLTRFW